MKAERKEKSRPPMDLPFALSFFPGHSDARNKLQQAWKAQIDFDAFKQMLRTISFRFHFSMHKRIPAKVIDLRDSELIRMIARDSPDAR